MNRLKMLPIEIALKTGVNWVENTLKPDELVENVMKLVWTGIKCFGNLLNQ
jgi:hypothetical protein